MPLSLDGTAANATFSGASSATVTLTTANANDVIVVLVAYEQTVARTVSSVTATGLTFTKRTAVASHFTGAAFSGMDIWWAPSVGALTAKVITVTMSGAIDNATIQAFGVTGAFNINSPWDSNIALPASVTSNSSGNVAGPNFSTTQANTFVVGCGMTAEPHNPTSAAWTAIGSVSNNGGSLWCYSGAFYHVYSSPQSGVASDVAINPFGQSAVLLVDAITADSTASAALLGQAWM
jgi:hypothetical protein